jgi:nucleotide-binding universal stress UspA family protein
VVIVPDRPATRTAVPTIVVGVADTAAGELALHFAFDEARRRRMSVTAVRAWEAANEPAELEGRLQAKLTAVQAEYPGVSATASLHRGDPAEAVLQAARVAELVVLGAHHSDNRWSTRLGPVPQTVLHHTGCPVVLVGTPEHRASRERAIRRARLR